MKKWILVLAFLDLLRISSQAQSEFREDEIFSVETGHSYIGFSVRYMGYANVKGRFNEFQGCVRFDQNNLDQTSASLAINVSSLDSGNEWRDSDLKSENWFDAKTYPHIFFKSEKVKVNASSISVDGILTIRNVTKKITLEMEKPIGVVKDVRSDSQVIFAGKTTLNRRDYGIEGKKWDGVMEGVTAVSDNVEIELTILGKRINAPNFKYWLGDEQSAKARTYRSYLSGGTSAALVTFNDIKKTKDAVDVETLDVVAHMLMKENKAGDAIVLLKKNMSEFPDQVIVYSSYAEAMLMIQNWAEARKFLNVVLVKETQNMYAMEVLKHLGAE